MRKRNRKFWGFRSEDSHFKSVVLIMELQQYRNRKDIATQSQTTSAQKLKIASTVRRREIHTSGIQFYHTFSYIWHPIRLFPNHKTNAFPACFPIIKILSNDYFYLL